MNGTIAVAARLGVVAMLGGIAGCASSGGAASKATTAPTPASMGMFDQLKKLEGTWVMKDENGQEQVALVTRVISGGNVVCETMFPGSAHEMVNMYHLDGGEVVVTHYCAVGNQPRMACASPARPGEFHFKFRDITNRPDPNAMYMGELVVRMDGGDKLSQEWTHFQNRQAAGQNARFDMTRRRG